MIDTGNLQQYDPPLTVYNRPNNLFVADFVGNPTMNFIKAKAKRVNKNTANLSFLGIEAKFVGEKPFEIISAQKPVEEVEKPSEESAPKPGEEVVETPVEEQEVVADYTKGDEVDVVLGIRPEFLPIRDEGKIKGLAYSTLPAGMETTVKINLNGEILSSVVFGSIDYKIDQEILFDIDGDGIILFNAETKENVCLGKVTVKKQTI